MKPRALTLLLVMAGIKRHMEPCRLPGFLDVPMVLAVFSNGHPKESPSQLRICILTPTGLLGCIQNPSFFGHFPT